MNIDNKIALIKQYTREVSTEIKEKSQNGDDYFMLEHLCEGIETNINLMGLFQE